MKSVLGAVLSFVFLCVNSAYADSGVPAPAFSLPDLQGKIHSLKDYEGKIVVLEWYNPGCPFVKKHYNSGNMQRLQKDYGDKGVVWFSVVSSAKGKQGNLPAGEHERILKEWNGSQFALLLDQEGQVGRLFGARTTPEIVVLGRDGKILYQGAVDDTPSTRPEDVKSAKNYVSQALNEILAGKAVTENATEPYGCGVKY